MADGGRDDQGDEDERVSDADPDLTGLSGGNGGIDITNMVHACAEEYQNLEQTLEEIDSYMNKIEKQNDSLSSQLDELLESSRQVRKDLQEQDPISSTEMKTDTQQVESACTDLQKDVEQRLKLDQRTCKADDTENQVESACTDMQKDVEQRLTLDQRTYNADADK